MVVPPSMPKVRVSNIDGGERVPLRLASVVVSAWSFSAMEAEVTKASGCIIRPGDGDGEGLSDGRRQRR